MSWRLRWCGQLSRARPGCLISVHTISEDVRIKASWARLSTPFCKSRTQFRYLSKGSSMLGKAAFVYQGQLKFSDRRIWACTRVSKSAAVDRSQAITVLKSPAHENRPHPSPLSSSPAVTLPPATCVMGVFIFFRLLILWLMSHTLQLPVSSMVPTWLAYHGLKATSAWWDTPPDVSGVSVKRWSTLSSFSLIL